VGDACLQCSRQDSKRICVVAFSIELAHSHAAIGLWPKRAFRRLPVCAAPSPCSPLNVNGRP
jgi:hypothetical protein